MNNLIIRRTIYALLKKDKFIENIRFNNLNILNNNKK